MKGCFSFQYHMKTKKILKGLYNSSCNTANKFSAFLMYSDSRYINAQTTQNLSPVTLRNNNIASMSDTSLLLWPEFFLILE